MTEPGEKIREHVNEIFASIDVIGLTLVGFAGLFKAMATESGVGAGLCLAVSLLAFGAIAFFRRP